MGNIRRLLPLLLVLLAAPLLAACGKTVTLYTDGDLEKVQALVAPYTRQTSQIVDVVYFSDVREMVAAIRKRENGQYVTTTHDNMYGYADVVFSVEKDTGEALMARGGLREYSPAEAGGIPDGARRDGWWYGTGGRAWVLMWNTELTQTPPSGLMDLAGESYPAGSVALINPNYILYYPCGAASILGADAVNSFLYTLIQRDAQWMAKPAETAQLVADGAAAVCLTTLNEARRHQALGAPVSWVLPDQGEGQMGAYVQFNIVAVASVSQYPTEAKSLADYLLAPDTEKLAVQLGLGDVTLRDCGADAPVAVPLKTDLFAAQDAMQNGIGMILTWFTEVNKEYTGK